MTLQERIDAEKARLESAKAAFSDDERAEMRQRQELASLQAERETEERAKRDVELERRLDAAREKLGETLVEGLSIKTFPDTFIVMRNGKAHASWMEALSRSQASGGKPVDRTAMHRKYAVQCVYDWNGITDFDANPESTKKLEKFLTNNPGIVTPITDLAARLAGIFADEKKIE